MLARVRPSLGRGELHGPADGPRHDQNEMISTKNDASIFSNLISQEKVENDSREANKVSGWQGKSQRKLPKKAGGLKKRACLYLLKKQRKTVRGMAHAP